MMTDLWVRATDGVVDYGPAPLPRNWRHVSGLDGLSDDELAPFGWHRCGSTDDAPAYDPRWQTRSGPVAVVDGEGWRAEWTVEGRPVEALRAERAAEVDRMRDQMMARGAEATIGESTLIVQTRGEADSRNVNGMVAAALVAQAAAPEQRFPFRDADDLVWDFSAADILALGAQVMAWVQAHYLAAWAHKAAIGALETAEAVGTYDVTAGWPE